MPVIVHKRLRVSARCGYRPSMVPRILLADFGLGEQWTVVGVKHWPTWWTPLTAGVPAGYPCLSGSASAKARYPPRSRAGRGRRRGVRLGPDPGPSSDADPPA